MFFERGKRQAALLTAAVLLAGLLTGCGARTAAPADVSGRPSGEPALTDTPEPVQTPAPEAVERTGYQMDITLTEGERPALSMTVLVTVLNDSEEAWEELCFRDFMASVHAEDQGRYAYVTDDDGNVIPYRPEPYTGGIKSARAEGQTLPIRVEGEDASVVYIGLPRPLEPGEHTILMLEYGAEIPPGAYRCCYFTTETDQASAPSATYVLAQFYPMLTVYEDGAWSAEPYLVEGECMYTRCADYDITFHLPEEYSVIASGEETRGETADGISTWHIAAERMRDVTVVAGTRYEVLTGEAQGVTVNSYYVNDGENGGKTAQGKLSLQAALDAVEAFTAAYGPYPYGELDVVQAVYENGGMEAPGLVRISDSYSWFMGEGNEPDPETGTGPDSCAATVAHEVAHEWFYGVVGDDQYNEAWLDESFAAFSEQVYWRYVGRSEEEIAAAMDEFSEDVPESGDVTVDRSYRALNSDYIRAVYQRGALFLYRLEQAMGQETFYEFLRAYYKANSFREVHTEDFVAALTPYIEENEAARALVETYLSRA